MYNIFKVGEDIFLSRWEKLDRDSNRDRVYFLAKSRTPEEWGALVVSAENHDPEKNIRKFIKALPIEAQLKWKSFAEEIVSLAVDNDKILRRKGVRALNEKFRNQSENSTDDEYFVTTKEDNYESGCWNCKKKVDSDYDLNHKVCGWLICGLRIPTQSGQ